MTFQLTGYTRFLTIFLQLQKQSSDQTNQSSLELDHVTAHWTRADLGVVYLHRVASTRNPEYGGIIKKLGELIRVQGGTRDEELDLWTEPRDVLHQTKQDVRVKSAFVSLIHNHHTGKGVWQHGTGNWMEKGKRIHTYIHTYIHTSCPVLSCCKAAVRRSHLPVRATSSTWCTLH